MLLRRGQVANKNLANKNLKVVPNILLPQNSADHERIGGAPDFFRIFASTELSPSASSPLWARNMQTKACFIVAWLEFERQVLTSRHGM
jgi:hypothetical protein